MQWSWWSGLWQTQARSITRVCLLNMAKVFPEMLVILGSRPSISAYAPMPVTIQSWRILITHHLLFSRGLASLPFLVKMTVPHMQCDQRSTLEGLIEGRMTPMMPQHHADKNAVKCVARLQYPFNCPLPCHGIHYRRWRWSCWDQKLEFPFHLVFSGQWVCEVTGEMHFTVILLPH